MFSKVLTISALVAVCSAGVIDVHNQAVSSQSIIRHDQPSQQIGHYATPVLQHSAPVIQHAPLIQNSAPLIQHSAPYIQHSAPLIQHSAPLIHHSAPYIQHSAPLIQHSAPLIQHSILEHGSLIHSAPIVQHVAHAPVVAHKVVTPISIGHAEEEKHAPAHYEFSYSVEDPHTGDHKSQHETREGDVVKGEYSLVQPDGSIRKVEYTADHHSGFNAIVHNTAPNAHAATQQDHGVATPILGHH